MHIRLLIRIFIVILAVARPTALQAQQKQVVFHPLDALTADEITQTVKLLKEAGDADQDTVYPAITLKPASKELVRAWKFGTPFVRTAFIILRKGLVTAEAIVDLTANKVLSFTPKPGGQPSIMDFEWIKARDAFMADKRFAAAISKRNLSVKNVFCTPNSAGTFPGDGLEGKRIVKIPCFTALEAVSPQAARPIEGLMGIVDSDTGQVLDVIDNEPVAMPPLPQGYGATLPQPGPLQRPIGIVAPQGSNIQLTGNLEVSWANWSMHLRPDKRAGVILNLVRFKDGARLRDIAYQMNIAEMFVPYMDPDPTWSYRTFMDAGEFGLGYMISSLKPGVDCPEASYFIDLTFPDDVGGTYTRSKALCIFERATGDPAWRHYSSAKKEITGIAQSEMVIRHIPTLGNYDYVVDYVFSPQGNITLRVGATGFDAVKSTEAKTTSDETSRYGTLIAPYTIAPNHDHYFSFRLDLDVDGPKNALVRDTIVPSKIADSKTRTSLWTLKSDRYAAEGPIAENHMSAGEAWRVMNPDEKTGLGYNPSYWLDAHHSATSVLDAADPPQHRAGFTNYSLWATRYAEGEDWSAGLYPNLSTKDQGLPAFVAQKRSINNEDLVLWYTMGFRHAPRPEDFPILPTYWHEFTLRPAFFFDRDPSMTFNPGSLPPASRIESNPMKLYGDLISPFVRMCMVTALEAGLGMRVQLVSAVLKPQEVNAALQKLSPIGKIPILETDHGHPLYDSRVIMEYFCHVAGNKSLLPDEGNKHFRVLTLLALAQGMGDAAVSLRYETATRPTKWPEFADRQQPRIKACMDEMETLWHDLLSEVTLGAIATAGVLAYIDIRGLSPDWRNSRPRLTAFAETFAARESMMHTAPKT